VFFNGLKKYNFVANNGLKMILLAAVKCTYNLPAFNGFLTDCRCIRPEGETLNV